eukprot:scaffold257_cov241-Pinguiococcus_pyrenoidosus.AAC.11
MLARFVSALLCNRLERLQTSAPAGSGQIRATEQRPQRTKRGRILAPSPMRRAGHLHLMRLHCHGPATARALACARPVENQAGRFALGVPAEPSSRAKILPLSSAHGRRLASPGRAVRQRRCQRS